MNIHTEQFIFHWSFNFIATRDSRLDATPLSMHKHTHPHKLTMSRSNLTNQRTSLCDCHQSNEEQCNRNQRLHHHGHFVRAMCCCFLVFRLFLVATSQLLLKGDSNKIPIFKQIFLMKRNFASLATCPILAKNFICCAPSFRCSKNLHFIIFPASNKIRTLFRNTSS